ncbi:MAG TPA: hypothetical protein PLF30_01085 [Candidatus Moranbacteria bacterium]|jgi:capsular polysaccharide biosynthesis protein|nr:hypothetical protein [Candidatus Moranbacteria bacterium]HOF42452.1 hypothetical protein [Candidatus Moranbacteria bacterium]HPX94130.1 hypothetical protein [Candidatus Moranbacteria bacterium]HQB59190.1 hypothetical protein [Candidatus Moranbacteria bacterium]
MQFNQILPLIRLKLAGIIMFGLLVAAFSFLALVVKEKNFKVNTAYLIVQNQGLNEDYYTLSKSAEYVGKVLGEGIYSELFIDEVLKTGKVNPEFLPFDKKEKMKEWGKNVEVRRNPDLGIMSIEVFDNGQGQALAVSNAISEVLISKNSQFLGEGKNISIKIISGPILEKNPSIENISATVMGGFVLGIMFSALWIISKEERRMRRIFSVNTAKRAENDGAEEYMESLNYIK